MTNSEILKIRGKIEIIKSDDLVSAKPARRVLLISSSQVVEN